MAKSLFSASWYRVAGLKLRLRGHAEIHRQRFRGQVWHVLQDHQTGRFHRLSPAANLMVSLMDGRRTLHEIWEMVGRRAGDDPPTQDEAIQLLAQLHGSDLLQGELPPDFSELSERSSKQARSNLLSRIRNPMALRLPLFDPDRFLDLTLPLVRPIFTVWGFLAWAGLALSAVVLGALHWRELTADGTDALLSTSNLLLIAAIYPLIKAIHEAGHAYATKVWGGAVHEVGVMLLILIPAPYVDATSSIAFRQRWRRVLVSGAGIMVEFALASIAMIVWVNAEPGLVRAAAFNVMLIGGVSTLFFNGNPLLRFDGYYILADLLEIPNFGTRANKYFWYVVQHYLLGIENAESPAELPGERKWLFGYAILSFIYRTVLSLTIALLVAGKLFFVGVLLALFSLYGTFVSPVWKGAKYLLTAPKLEGHRKRAMWTSGGLVAACLALFFVVPLPFATMAQGVVWVPDRAELRAKAAGTVSDVLAMPDTIVAAGAPLVRLEDPSTSGRVRLLEAQKRELQLRYEAVRFADRTQADMLREQIRNVDGVLASVKQRSDDLVVRAEQSGRFVLPDAANLKGRFVKQGDLVGYVMAKATPALRVIVPQDEVDLVRARTKDVAVRYASALDHVVPAKIAREVPSAQVNLPSLALSVEGGGSIATRASRDGAKAVQGLFVFDLLPDAATAGTMMGSRVYVRFDHGTEPIAWRVARTLRQVFLSHFDV